MKTPRRRVLTINAGSSSLKFALFASGAPLRRLFSGSIERVGLPGTVFAAHGGAFGAGVSRPMPARDHAAAASGLLELLAARGADASADAVGHRVVIGGPNDGRPRRVTDELLEDLRRFSALDAAHMPAEIRLIETFRKRFPGRPQVACFDTTFHRDLPRVARVLPIPRRYEALGVRRYGFHGLAYASVMREFGRRAGNRAAAGRIILAHLGSGASLAAVSGGRSLDTTMSFTPSSGIPMSTRSGDLDPGLVGHLCRAEKRGAEGFSAMAASESGLLGISETSSDMRDLLAAAPRDVRAEEAVAVFCYEAKKRVGAFAAALGGVDALVFSGGIGERSPEVRARICSGLGFLGLALDASRNAANAGEISARGARTSIRVIPADEELMIAAATLRTLARGDGNAPHKSDEKSSRGLNGRRRAAGLEWPGVAPRR